jgi:YidC/Oxa1 family membrane protein insertase
MPVFFTFLLASFPAGLVIYWAWNNTLSVIQQSVIMARQGVEIPLFENLGFKPKKKSDRVKASTVEEKPKKSRRQTKAAEAEARKAEDEAEGAETEPKS